MNIVRHSVRSNHGRTKGRFVSEKVFNWKQNLRASRQKSGDGESEVSARTYVDSRRRVVDFRTLAQDLWCDICNVPLSLRNVMHEERFGMASRLDVLCEQCNENHTVETNKRRENNRLYDVNSKAAIAMIDAGIGETQFNTVLSALNIPALTGTILKRYERHVGPAFEKAAEDSCHESIKLEKAMTIAARREHEEQTEEPIDDENDFEGPVDIAASVDAGWQKRGTGRSYNSLSGHLSLIGHRSQKILSYAVRSKACSSCARGRDPNDHDCRKNFEGSAKSMEPNMAVEVIAKNKLLEEENVRVAVLIGDDDSSTIAAVRRELTTKVEKWSDLNHASKALNNALYGLHLPTKVIGYLSRCFTSAVKQNQGDPIAVAEAIKNITCHAFGEHENCGDWCGHKILQENYKHKGLPKGEPLTDTGLRDSLTRIFSRFAQNSKKLAPCASSQVNESFNHTVASKAPKSKFYAGSESLNFRVAASVCQKNIGVTYVDTLNKILELSPGMITKRFRAQKEQTRKSKIRKSKTVEMKRRRLFHKNQRSTKGAAAERSEGITYETGSGLTCVSELINDNPSAFDGDTQQQKDLHDNALVIFDLETTGLSKAAEICQIAAVYNNEVFNAYIVPSKGMTSRAATVTGLRVCGGEMYLDDARVDTTPPRMALQNFIEYLRSNGPGVILVAHNGFRMMISRLFIWMIIARPGRFDAPKILRTMREYGLLDQFQSVVKGFADTLPLFREHLPGRKKESKGYSQTALTEDILGSNAAEGAHNAVKDVVMLSQLVSASGISEDNIKCNAKTTRDILYEEEIAVTQARNKQSLLAMKETVSAGMIGKMTKTGITMQVLETAYMRSGAEGIRILLGEDVNGKPRVTKNNKIFKAIVAHVEKTTVTKIG